MTVSGLVSKRYHGRLYVFFTGTARVHGPGQPPRTKVVSCYPTQ